MNKSGIQRSAHGSATSPFNMRPTCDFPRRSQAARGHHALGVVPQQADLPLAENLPATRLARLRSKASSFVMRLPPALSLRS